MNAMKYYLCALSVVLLLSVPAYANVCNGAEASMQDVNHLGLYYPMINACQQHVGHKPGKVTVNADNYPHRMCLNAEASKVTWTGLTPSTAERITARSSYTNPRGSSFLYTFKLGGSIENSVTMSTSNTVGFSESVSFTVGVPEVLQAQWSLQATFSSTQTHSQTQSSSVSFSDTISATLAAGQTANAYIEASAQVYESKFEVPICISGYFRCSYSSPVSNNMGLPGTHFWYYLPTSTLQGQQMCLKQSGTLSSRASIATSGRACVQPDGEPLRCNAPTTAALTSFVGLMNSNSTQAAPVRGYFRGSRQ